MSNETKHTPEPWEAAESSYPGGGALAAYDQARAALAKVQS